ncbi:hypothetical protein LVD17_01665 [Fulvivirga ulvae]|uniref:hypothetical protein n=1 Tax=Fulvivirga ulvae TaxID=2904245 RepID=UPI001F32D41E|nr:hypothetical protein [Fulvivirga ulvae]UII32546.1 hypothetical protein LVD17_01665 [Fulvivirga ulvae]
MAPAFYLRAQTIAINYSIGATGVWENNGWEPLGGYPAGEEQDDYTGHRNLQLGFTYSHFITKKLTLESGVYFSHYDLKTRIRHDRPLPSLINYYEISYFTLPLSADLTFGKWFFLCAGARIDFSPGNSSLPEIDKFGLGLEAGLGVHTYIDNFYFRFKPHIRNHAITNFKNKDLSYDIWNANIEISVGHVLNTHKN